MIQGIFHLSRFGYQIPSKGRLWGKEKLYGDVSPKLPPGYSILAGCS